MNKIQTTLAGHQVLVDVDTYKLLIRKIQLVESSMSISSMLRDESNNEAKAIVKNDLALNASKIISINRKLKKANITYI